MFITFEGLDFCGKSTQVKLLQKYLEQIGRTVKLIREPGGVQIAEKIRELLLDKKNNEMVFETELLLFASSRAQLVREFIIPNLEKNNIIISDRFHDSSVAYQGFARGLNIDFVKDLQKFAIGEAIPELTFFIDIPLEEVAKRKNKLAKDELDRIEVSKSDFYEKVRDGYNKIADEEERFVKLDGLMSIEKLHDEIVKIVKSKLKD